MLVLVIMIQISDLCISGQVKNKVYIKFNLFDIPLKVKAKKVMIFAYILKKYFFLFFVK